MAMNVKHGAGPIRRAFRRGLRSEIAQCKVTPLDGTDVIPLNQVFFVNSSPGAMKIRKVSVWLEAQDAGETVTLYRSTSGTAIQSGDAILASAFSLASATNALDTLHEPALSTSVSHTLKPGQVLGIVLSAGTDTANFCLAVDLIPA